MKDFAATPKEMVASLWRNRDLIQATAKRDVVGRYQGSAMGLLWSFFNPVLMLAIYTFVFSEIFKTRWNTASDSKTEFALILFAGLIVFNMFAECLNRAPGIIISNTNYVKKVVYPLETLPFVGLVSSMFHAAVSLCVWFIAYLIFFGLPHPSVILLPFIIIPFFLFTMGVSWALASLGVYLRDVSQIIAIITTVLMFMSPIFYPVSSLPPIYQKALYINPLTIVIEQTREVLYFGHMPNFKALIVLWMLSALAAWLGFAWFQKTRKGFSDVL